MNPAQGKRAGVRAIGSLGRIKKLKRHGSSPPTPYHTLGSLAPVGDVQLNYVLEGDPHKPLLALIPMARHNLTMWERLMPDLLSQFRVLRFDIRGMGRSTGGAQRAIASNSTPMISRDF